MIGKSGLERLLALALALAVDLDIASRCVAAAKRHFSLDEGVSRYRSIYEQIGG